MTEEERQLSYDLGYPVCVDNDPPQFVNCPTSAARVKRTAQGIEPVDFVVPTATNNSGMIARTEVCPEGIRPSLTVFQDTMVEYFAYDFDGNVAICLINITVVDQEPPVPAEFRHRTGRSPGVVPGPLQRDPTPRHRSRRFRFRMFPPLSSASAATRT